MTMKPRDPIPKPEGTGVSDTSSLVAQEEGLLQVRRENKAEFPSGIPAL